jgi:hypothetical protein
MFVPYGFVFYYVEPNTVYFYTLAGIMFAKFKSLGKQEDESTKMS